jgi:3-methyl-2-oxobutanoate hydroxymethyltransferase
MVTAYDFPSAVHVARAGIDCLLVGDSAAMVELGFETTQPITLDQMLVHCQSVKRGVQYAGSPTPLLIGDMPFGSYEFEDTDVALRNAYRFVKEAGMDAVKLEGGSVARARTVHKIVEGGVAVMGHVGLTPQAISVIGGFRAQGRTATRARALLDDAMRLQDAGAFAIVLECVPANVAKAITESLEIPTIGIGAGPWTSGQVLVFHDLLGMLSHPHHEQFMPKFCKQYAHVGHTIQDGLTEFKQDVEQGKFPAEEFSPYIMSDKEKKAFDALLEKDEQERQQKHEEAAVKLTQADEYEQLHLYGQDSGGRDKKG